MKNKRKNKKRGGKEKEMKEEQKKNLTNTSKEIYSKLIK